MTNEQRALPRLYAADEDVDEDEATWPPTSESGVRPALNGVAAFLAEIADELETTQVRRFGR